MVGAEPRRRDVGDDPAALVEELPVDRRAEGLVDAWGTGSLQERQGAGAGPVDLAERSQVDHADSLAARAVLLPHPLDPRRPCPPSLPGRAPVARPRLARSVQVRALPAGLRSELGARGL